MNAIRKLFKDYPWGSVIDTIKIVLWIYIIFLLAGCAPRAYVRKNNTNVYDVPIPQEVTDIQIWVDGQWWTVERFVRPVK